MLVLPRFSTHWPTRVLASRRTRISTKELAAGTVCRCSSGWGLHNTSQWPPSHSCPRGCPCPPRGSSRQPHAGGQECRPQSPPVACGPSFASLSCISGFLWAPSRKTTNATTRVLPKLQGRPRKRRARARARAGSALDRRDAEGSEADLPAGAPDSGDCKRKGARARLRKRGASPLKPSAASLSASPRTALQRVCWLGGCRWESTTSVSPFSAEGDPRHWQSAFQSTWYSSVAGPGVNQLNGGPSGGPPTRLQACPSGRLWYTVKHSNTLRHFQHLGAGLRHSHTRLHCPFHSP